MSQQLGALADELERDQTTIQRELDEIALLLRQATSEAERHEARRVQAEERLTALERETGPPSEAISEARTQLLSQTRRATLMQAQMDVLAGKERTLQRYKERITSTLPVLRGADSEGSAGVATDGDTRSAKGAGSGDVLAAQEQMRREIARQMHDGPAQSIANIALHAQIVQRLFERDPERAARELGELVAMVQQALEATKSFIFDVRPMVLDDLGLVPTLRRSARERSRRSGTAVRFDSVGTDRRLPTELESGIFRMVDDAIVGFLDVHPVEIMVRLDWSESALRVTVRGQPQGAAETAEVKARAAVAAARRDRAMPAALVTMVHEQESDDAARNAGLPEQVCAEIEQRAVPLNVGMTMSEDRWLLELVVSRSA